MPTVLDRSESCFPFLYVPVDASGTMACQQASAAAAAKDLDVLIIGATGFTGRLVSAYLTSQPGVSVGLGGRSAERLEALKEYLLTEVHRGSWPCKEPALVPTPFDSLGSCVSRARVVLCTAGPFLRSSLPVVEACVRCGADYVDITGETPFVRKTIDLFDPAARAKGCFVVSMCGFDSIPSDLGTLRTVQRIRRELGEATRRVSCFVTMRGQLSGGTLESGLEMERDPATWRQVKDPFLLGGERAGGLRAEDQDVTQAAPLDACLGVGAEAATNATPKSSNLWTAPFMMAELNTRTVRRSCALFEEHEGGGGYGAQFGYSERLLMADEATARAVAKPPPPVEKRESMRAQGRLPKPGEGPSAEERAKGRFKFFFVGESESARRVTTSVAGGDPGYSETAKMASEAALCLLKNRGEINAVKRGLSGGVLTPAFCFGDALIGRLEKAGVHFRDEAGWPSPAHKNATPPSKL
mmetsp:Transcript_44467/g.100514  ORF Transcript_44467/g.100514 Transcript_44467/m.100514 type:complete len:470 (+) Transcript_44467:37-1446(+)